MIRKKLIEVALPLEAINKASAREKSIRHGHPNTLHLWWARRPLAAARAVIFAQMVDDPSAYVDTLRADPRLKRKAETTLRGRMKLWEEARDLAHKAKGTKLSVPEPGPQPTLDEVLADIERQRLFRIIEELVLWENTTNETVLQAARDEIWASWRRACAENADHSRAKELFDRKKLPAFHDPFAGGGALPLEAQRLGLEAHASDLNPIAVLINKAMIEIPPRFSGKPPINPEARKDRTLFARQWKGAEGLAEDVRHYGKWIRDEAEKRIGHLYPKVDVTAEMARGRPDLKPYVGTGLTVIAWLWARTVKSPNPAFGEIEVPLASTFLLSSKAGKDPSYVVPVIEDGSYRFSVKTGAPKDPDATKMGTSAGKWSGFRCVMSGVPITYEYIRQEGVAGRIGSRLMAVVAEGARGRVYISPTPSVEAVAGLERPQWIPDLEINYHPRDIKTQIYGLTRYSDLFTERQLVALETLCDLVQGARERAHNDALAVGLGDDGTALSAGGIGAKGYSDAVSIYLSFAISKTVDRNSTLCFWERPMDRLRGTFGRQALPMVWDYAETNPFAGAGGDFYGTVHSLCEVLDQFVVTVPVGRATQSDARAQSLSSDKVASTDPPYYDNIGYADLSDFFYVWLRHLLVPIVPELFATLAVPKAEELVATPYRHGTKEKAEAFFLDGMTQAMHSLAQRVHPAFPVTIYYAFKQAENDVREGVASTGWDTFLDAVIRAGFSISGTWPVRTEQLAGLKGKMNALASSIVLVCRPRAASVPTATRREFLVALKRELPEALVHLQRGNIAPVDLAQAAIGPGMAIFTRYSTVLDAEGRPLAVREALSLINQTLDEALAEQEGDFDADSRWALTWFEQSGFDEGEYGVAEQLSKSKNTSVAGMADAGIVESKRGKVRLLRPEELPREWVPDADPRLTAWEIVHHLIRVIASGGEGKAAGLVAILGAKAEIARELAYRLYTVCERKKRATEALAYNGLVQSWPEIVRLARERPKPIAEQGGLFAEIEE